MIKKLMFSVVSLVLLTSVVFGDVIYYPDNVKNILSATYSSGGPLNLMMTVPVVIT